MTRGARPRHVPSVRRLVAPLTLALVAAACTGSPGEVRFDDPGTTVASEPAAAASSTATTATPAPADTEAPARTHPEADAALDRFNIAMSEGDTEVAGELLAAETVFFFDVVAALAISGEPAEFDRTPLLAGVYAGVLRGFSASPVNGIEAFRQLASLGQIPALPISGSLEWFETQPGELFGLVEGSAFVTLRLEDGAWKVDLTQMLILSETQRHADLLARTGLAEGSPASALILEPTGFVEAEPPVPRDGGAMGILPAPVWGRFLRAVDSMEWMDAYGMLGSLTRIDDSRGIPAVEIARQNALSGNESTFAGLAFADALLALVIRASYAPEDIPDVPGGEIFGLAMEAGVVKLAATTEDLAWQTTSGIRYLGLSSTAAAGVFRSGPDWLVDGNVVAASAPSDFAATEGVGSSDRIGLLLAALNQITGGAYDAAFLAPVG